MAGELGKASLDLEANLGPFEKNVHEAERSADSLNRALDALAAIADVADKQLNEIGMSPGKAAESRLSAEQILRGVSGISDESRIAALELDRVKLSESQAAETEAAGAVIDHELDKIHDKAGRTRRALDRVRLAGGRNGVGVGPFGSGFGRIGLLGAAVGLGVLTVPAAGPAALGLLAAIPVLAGVAAGALGVLALAGAGVAKAIGGDKKAFDDLTTSQKQFVLTVRSLDGWFDRLKQTAAQSLFPGLTAGLKAALSPGTTRAITTAVTELGHALGSAGAQWGKYFGSREFQSIFGPLMKSAARNISVLSDAALHLFDSLGVLARAAIPFTNWLTSAIDRGAKLADSWLHAKDASGELGKGMTEAKTSLTLVWHLLGSIIHVIVALGVALYPVAKVAVKLLTDGLNALARIIHRNENGIRELVRGALDALVTTIKIAVPIVRALARVASFVAHALGGWKPVILGIIGLKFGFVVAGWARSLRGLFVAETTAATGMGGLRLAALRLAGPFALAAGAVLLLDKALAKLTGFDALNKAWGSAGWFADNAGGDKFDGKNPYPIYSGDYWEWQAGKYHLKKGDRIPGGKGILANPTNAAYEAGEKASQHPRSHGSKPGTRATTSGGDVFGTPPSFTKNLGSAIPDSVTALDALAARQDQQASALHYAGTKARAHLEMEISDLEKADRLLQENLKHAHGKLHTQLFNALTANLKKIAEARQRAGDAIAKGRQSQLSLALDQAKLAVENAQQGSKAWDRAIAAEEKALRAEIHYWDKRAHNTKLSADVRDAALKKEIGYEHQLKSLLTQRTQAVAANEAQFLQTYLAIQNTFGPNTQPEKPDHTGKMATHLHDVKNELRHQTKLLTKAADAVRFPGSRQSFDSAMAATS